MLHESMVRRIATWMTVESYVTSTQWHSQRAMDKSSVLMGVGWAWWGTQALKPESPTLRDSGVSGPSCGPGISIPYKLPRWLCCVARVWDHWSIWWSKTVSWLLGLPVTLAHISSLWISIPISGRRHLIGLAWDQVSSLVQVANLAIATPFKLGYNSQEWEAVSWGDIPKGDWYNSLCHYGIKLYCNGLFWGLWAL